MPSGNVHDKITLYTTPLIGLGMYQIDEKPQNLFIILGLYIFSSLMFNGDLDIKSKPFNRWGILKLIWLPYQSFFSHRSLFTHGIIIGTIVRLIYLSPIIYTLWLINSHMMIFDFNSYNILLILIGLELGNTIHTVSDWLF